MQIAASNPVSVDQSGVPDEIVSKERDIYKTQAQNSGKPEKIWDRIVEGKLAKFYKEIVLMDQAYVKDPDQSVTDRIKATEKELGTTISIRTFVRYEVGAEE
jgi:elongation factor Ts